MRSSEEARRIVREFDEEHPPGPLPLEVERRIVKLWGPMKVDRKKRKKAA